MPPNSAKCNTFVPHPPLVSFKLKKSEKKGGGVPLSANKGWEMPEFTL